MVFRSFRFCISVLIVTSRHQESHTNCAANTLERAFTSFCLSSQSLFTATITTLCPRSPSHLHLALKMNKGTAVLGLSSCLLSEGMVKRRPKFLSRRTWTCHQDLPYKNLLRKTTTTRRLSYTCLYFALVVIWHK